MRDHDDSFHGYPLEGHNIFLHAKFMCKNKTICFINHNLVGFEPTGKCPIDVLVKTI